MNLLRRLFEMVTRLFRRKQEPTVEEEKKVPSYMRKPSKLVKMYLGQWSYGFPNSPKRQPCWKCGKRVKRSNRSKTRAEYECKRCGTVSIISLKGG